MVKSKSLTKTGKSAAKQVRFVLQERIADPKEWKRRVKNLDAWPNLKVKDWRPILEELTRKEVHHKDALYF